MLTSWPLVALVAGVKIGVGSRSDSRSPGGNSIAADGAGRQVVLPAGAREISARDALDRHRAGLPHQHGPAGQDRRVSLERRRETVSCRSE